MVERAAVSFDWLEWWARPKQLAPSGPWRSWGLCTGRGFGKTRAIAEYVHREAMSGRAKRIVLIAQNDKETTDVMVQGDAGLLSVAPPWEAPVYEAGCVRWPNGAKAFLHTPQAPGAIRGPGFHLAWISELVEWPATKRDEALSNLRLTLRLGYARLVWDTTPKRRNEIIRDLLERSKRSPERHVVVRGSSYENAANLNQDALDEWREDLEGTQRGREELHGELIEDEAGIVKLEWIEKARREMPGQLERRVIAVDPAISMRRSTDASGIVECGLGTDGQYYVIEDLSGRLAWEVWGGIVVERYVRHHCDCVVVERNRGGDAVAANIRACGRDRGIVVTVVPASARTKHEPGRINVKETQARSSKETRADPVAALYEKGLVSHVSGSNLIDLEDEWTMWDPASGKSPNNLDACVWALWELSGLAEDRRSGRATAGGVAALGSALRSRAGAHGLPSLTGLASRFGRGTSRI